MKTRTVKIAELSQDPANVRRHPDRNLEAIKASLRRFGQQKPIVADKSGIVRAGNGTLEAARLLGWDTIQVVHTDLSGSEATAYAIADNRTGELAEWDNEALAVTLQALMDEDAGWAELLGYDDEELSALVPEFAPGADDGVDPGPGDAPAHPKSRWGEVYSLGLHRVMCGDSTDSDCVNKLLDGESPGVWMVDPPYEMTDWSAMVVPGDSVSVAAVWHRGSASYRWMADAFGNWPSVNDLVFTGGTRGNPYPKSPCCLHDHVTLWRRGDLILDVDVLKAIGADCSSDGRPHSWQQSWGGNQASSKLCPWGKPLKQFELVLAFSGRDSVVYDGCMGGGTSLIAAATHGNRFVGMEVNPSFCDVIRARWGGYARNAGVDPGLDAL